MHVWEQLVVSCGALCWSSAAFTKYDTDTNMLLHLEHGCIATAVKQLGSVSFVCYLALLHMLWTVDVQQG